MSNITTIKSIPAEPTEVDDYSGLVAHELANVMPWIEGQEFEHLKNDLKANGLKNKIVLFEGRILDGRNRYKALREIGHVLVSENFEVFHGTYAEAEAYVISANMMRRQMTNAQKAEVVERMIVKYPDKSNRRIAELCHVAHSFVGTVKDRLDNPKEKKEWERFCKVFEVMDDRWRGEFARRYANDLRELLSA